MGAELNVHICTCSYEHVVYMLDGLIYALNNWPKAVVMATLNSNQSEAESSVFEPTNQNTASDSSKLESHQMEIDDNSKTASRTESQYRFFQRTESVTITTGDDPEILRHNDQFFGTDGTATTLALEQPELAGPPTPWRGAQDGRFSQPLNEAYPLAQKPHLLKPFAKKEHLFSSSVSSEGSSELERGEEKGDRPRLSVSYSNPVTRYTCMCMNYKHWLMYVLYVYVYSWKIWWGIKFSSLVVCL